MKKLAFSMFDILFSPRSSKIIYYKYKPVDDLPYLVLPSGLKI